MISQTLSSPNNHWSTADTDTWLYTRKITILHMQCSKTDEQMHFCLNILIYTYLCFLELQLTTFQHLKMFIVYSVLTAILCYLKRCRVSKSRSIWVIGKSRSLFHVCKVRENFNKIRHFEVQVNVRIKP